jgi:pimeloyl-ACP methyl ester carboxylesterase
MITSLQSIPAFIVWGSKDSPGKKRSKQLLAIFKKGISFEIEGASHPCYLDEPDMFNRAVTSFLNNEVMIARSVVVTSEV